MSRRAEARIREPEIQEKAGVTPFEPTAEQRRQISALLRERMATPATDLDRQLWNELAEELRRERPDFTS